MKSDSQDPYPVARGPRFQGPRGLPQPWHRRLQDYLGQIPIRRSERYSEPFRRGEEILDGLQALDLHSFLTFSNSEMPDRLFHLKDRVLVMTEAATGERLGCIRESIPVVPEQFRGRRYGRDLLLIEHDRERLFAEFVAAYPSRREEAHLAFKSEIVRRPSFFTEAGLYNRMEVHRFTVQRALTRREEVSADVLADYDVSDQGEVRRVLHWGVDQQEAWALAAGRSFDEEFRRSQESLVSLAQGIGESGPELD